MSPIPHWAAALLLATKATANFTTSYYLPNPNFLPSRIRFLASVIAADKDRVTLAARYDDDPDYAALDLNLDARFSMTMTLASTLYAQTTTYTAGGGEEEAAVDPVTIWIRRRCEIDVDMSGAQCTAEYNEALALRECYRAPPGLFDDTPVVSRVGTTWVTLPPETHTAGQSETLLWTFSDTDAAGVQTIVRPDPHAENYYSNPPPDWCSGFSQNYSNVVVPSSALTSSWTLQKSEMGLFGFTITAGEEKMAKATTGASVTVGSATPTATGTGAGAGRTGGGSAGAAPARTMAPALWGVGAAVAMFL
ncbi:hypothetical protein DPSP01_005018 [Paraphaeosphaeria sporulosa]|uniref:Uncharacterized protein n=1 Tax=Paraphaeosphaeria sporulosa TaxID=1460663 RepID=A0A177C1Z3_9PLEO|nr:uncharacterized protein CC84DRAFT_271632 [Paraphaeosphaeria sporulosa]OAG00909.1 hypothetical protein CC84DRAFT_271632 [Paraphaeosphaeria sporulosa]